MKRLLTNLLICAASFAVTFTAARSRSSESATESPGARQLERKPASAGPAKETVLQVPAADAIALADANFEARDRQIAAMTAVELRGYADALYDTMRLDTEATTTGDHLINAWGELESLEALHWCQAHHFAFARRSTCGFFQRIAENAPDQAASRVAELRNVQLREEALSGIAFASPLGEEQATLDRLLSFGAPGEESASNWLKTLSIVSPQDKTALKTAVMKERESRIRWRSETIRGITP